ncbi:MAG: tRNA (adenosine(37)-N6)-threonylcarbamoyltransferase complex dimerization subunit type 1 TsaB [Chlamydiales bacterium]|nr:tRNA (adenosine(37)-N6)-threonylcarbamoyltransferase complex dimerization subunit type 1 TsaB [Chlamydiales bacterium]
MISLLIETCTERGLIAVYDKHVCLFEEFLPIGLQNSTVLVPAMERALIQAKLTAGEIQLIIVGNGPGSYTGIRVGVAAGQAFAYAHKLPLVGVSPLYGLIPNRDCSFASVIDAKIGGAYFLLGRRNGESIQYLSEPALEPLELLQDQLADVEVIVTSAAAPLQKRLDGPWDWTERAPSSSQIVSIGLEEFTKGHFSLDAKVEIHYLRKTQAEIEKENPR